jgi:hypothetical protein
MNKMINPTQNKYFEVRVAGHLSPDRYKMFKGLKLSELDNGETLIRGKYVDQAQLFGILILIRDMGIPLLSMKIFGSQTETEKELRK